MSVSVAVTLLMNFFIIVNGQTQNCYQMSCLGCPAEAVWQRGNSVECRLDNWVSPVWLHNLGHPPPPPATASRVPIDYRCLKMTATPDDSTHGRTADVVRGCVPAVQSDSVCAGLVAVERARGHSDARCLVCWGDNCNAAAKQDLSIFIILATTITYLIVR